LFNPPPPPPTLGNFQEANIEIATTNNLEYRILQSTSQKLNL
jgi:hypothetical protein